MPPNIFPFLVLFHKFLSANFHAVDVFTTNAYISTHISTNIESSRQIDASATRKMQKYVRHIFTYLFKVFLDLEKEPQNKMESSVLGSGAVVNGCCRGRLALRDVAAVKGRQQCTPYVPRAGWLLCSVLSEASQLASFPTAPGCSAVITNISRALLCAEE